MKANVPEPAESKTRAAADFEDVLHRCYRDQALRRRMREFLGGSSLRNATAAYIVGADGGYGFSRPASPSTLPEFLDAGMDVQRSLWDVKSLIADIDLEYDNFDCPGAAWLDPSRAFGLQAPVAEATLKILGDAGVSPQVLISGRGFHFVWKISRNSPAFHRLVRLGQAPPSLEARYARVQSPAGKIIDPDLGRAYAGLGLVFEFVAHRVLAVSSAKCEVPVQITAIEVGPGSGGREIVSFDLSEYGDPLDTRHVRLPFSVYAKPRRTGWAAGDNGVSTLPPIFEIPLSGRSVERAIVTARDPDAVLALARRFPAFIPDQSDPTARLLDEYETSELAGFHRDFYGELWGRTAQYSPTPALPDLPCVTWLIDHPNDWLLKPAAVQHIARVLTAVNWRPRDVVQLIYSCYMRDCDWGRTWERLDPFNRALFYTRLFTGMITTGLDKLIDMNCVSHREKGYCAVQNCSSNLAPYRDTLLERKSR